MDEKKFAVMLTDTQEIKTLECDPQEELLRLPAAPSAVNGSSWWRLSHWPRMDI